MRKFFLDESGATAVEYALIAVLVSIAIISGASKIGTNLSTLHYGPLADAFNH